MIKMIKLKYSNFLIKSCEECPCMYDVTHEYIDRYEHVDYCGLIDIIPLNIIKDSKNILNNCPLMDYKGE